MAAILLALLSIVVWSSLAFLNSRVNALPPFLAVGVALCVGGLVGLFRAREWRVPLKTFAVGIGGIFGYHALLFAAFRIAPSVEVNLINYLWPLLIVLLSPVFLKGFRLGPRHVAGAVLGLAGAALIVSGGKLKPDAVFLPGYLLAAAAAFVWASYSLLTKRLPPFPTGAVGGFCLVSGILSLAVYFLGRVVPVGPLAPAPILSPLDWLFLVLLGLGPMGGAFYAWDAALKRGDPRVIGALSYLTPLLSTLNLVLLGGKRLSPVAGIAMSLIVAGAVVGSLELIKAALCGRENRFHRPGD
ncbi:MAG: DMT family transporter [Rectinemataceae bacterium]|jgi:drug/metabolite transporter (DMT)-like permease